MGILTYCEPYLHNKNECEWTHTLKDKVKIDRHTNVFKDKIFDHTIGWFEKIITSIQFDVLIILSFVVALYEDLFTVNCDGVSVFIAILQSLFNDYGTVLALFQFGRVKMGISVSVDGKRNVKPIWVGSEFDHWDSVSWFTAVTTVCDSSDWTPASDLVEWFDLDTEDKVLLDNSDWCKEVVL